MDSSLPLVTFTPDTHGTSHSDFLVSEDALHYLETIPAPISVVSVAGMYRTGKSYLLNRVILNRKLGFQVGPSVNPCTKGMWVWGKTLSAITSEDEPCQVIVIDSEGIGALDEDADHDARIFSLAILLSSVFIYNSTVAIDETSLENLSLVVNLTKHIHVKSQQDDDVDEQDYAAYFPAFCWVVRDFSLQLIDDKGDRITSKEYLERALAEQKGFAEATEERNRIRRLLKGFFPDRDCVTMVRPTNNEEQLCSLETTDISELRPEFQTQVYRLREKLLTKVKPKTLNGKYLSGAMLANLLRAYVTAINTGAVPSIESAWTYICQNECAKAVDEAMRTYTAESDCNIHPNMPISNEELKEWHKSAKEKAISCFSELAVGQEKDAVQKELITQISKKYAVMKAKNEELAASQTDEMLQSLYDRIETRLRNGEFDSFQQYLQEIDAFQTYFREKGPKGANRNLQMVDFSHTKALQVAEEFIDRLKNELEMTGELATERIAAITKESSKVKEQYLKYKNESQGKAAQLESERTELTVVNAALSNQLTIAKAEIDRLEKANRESVKLLRQELTGNSLESDTKIEQLEELIKENEQKAIQTDSDYQQKIALLEQKVSFLEKSLMENSDRERSYLEELTNQKKEHTVEVKDLLGKHEDTLSKIQQQVVTETDRVAELETEIADLKGKIDVILTQKREIEASAEAKVATLMSQIASFKGVIEAKEKDFRQEKNDLIEEFESTEERLQGLLDESKRRVKSVEDSYKSEISTLRGSNGLLTQQVEFLQQQLDEAKRQFVEAEQHHETMLSALRASSITANQGHVDQEIIKMREELTAEMKTQQARSDEERNKLLKEVADLAEKCETLSVKSRGDVAEWKTKETNLTAKVDSLTSEKSKLSEKLTELEVVKVKEYEQRIDRLEAKVEELESDLEESRSKSSLELSSLNQRASENLQHITAAYDAEKSRLMQLIQKEKEKAEERVNLALEEYEEKAHEDAAIAEDRIAELESQLDEIASAADIDKAQCQKQIALDAQRIEGLEKLLKEAKDTLNVFQTTHGASMEQQLLSFQRERASLQVKIERLATDLSGKDKDLMTALYANEQLSSQLSLKERELEEVRTDLGSDRAILQERLEESKLKLRQLTEESTRKTSDFAKELALARQELEFQSKRIIELLKVKEENDRRFHETISALKEEKSKEIADIVERFGLEKDILDKKLSQKRKDIKEIEESYMRQITNLEKERAIASEKMTSLEGKIADMEIRHSQELSALRSNLDRKDPDSKGFALQQEIERLSVRIFESEKEITDKSSAHDRDKTLWENKFNFLMAQRDAARTELANSQRKFEQALEEFRKIAMSDKEKPGKSGIIAALESRFATETRELTEKFETKLQEMTEKYKATDRELRVIREELELERRDRSTNSGSVTTRLQGLVDSESKLRSQLQAQTLLWEKRISEEKASFDQEKSSFKAKIASLELRLNSSEQQYTNLNLETEKERARAAMDRDHILAQRNEFQEKVAQLQKRNESLLRENEKLRADRSAKNKSPIGGRKDTAPRLGNATFQELMQGNKGDSTPGGGKAGIRGKSVKAATMSGKDMAGRRREEQGGGFP